MGKPDTFDRIEKSYRRWRGFIIGWRVFVVIVAAFYLWMVLSGVTSPWMALYLLFPPLWWALSIQWAGTAEDTRETRLRTLRMRNEMAAWRTGRI